MAKDLLTLLGDENAFAEALDAAMTEVARDDALVQLRVQLTDRVLQQARAIMIGDREGVVAAFADPPPPRPRCSPSTPSSSTRRSSPATSISSAPSSSRRGD